MLRCGSQKLQQIGSSLIANFGMRNSAGLMLFLSAARIASGKRVVPTTGSAFSLPSAQLRSKDKIGICAFGSVPQFVSLMKSRNQKSQLHSRWFLPLSSRNIALFGTSAPQSWNSEALPIDEVLDELLRILKQNNCCVLQAAPGAGKTTRVPLAILLQPSILPNGVSPENRVLILEPRILAAKASAARMAESLGEPLGKRVGYRVRHDSQVRRRRALTAWQL